LYELVRSNRLSTGRAKNKVAPVKRKGCGGGNGVSRDFDRAVTTLGKLAGDFPARAKGRSVTVGLVGRAIQSSRSPIMHEREGARLGMQYRYVLIDFDDLGLEDASLGEIVSAAERLGFAGLNVTHPFKQNVIAHLTGLAHDAEMIGAVNTVVFADKKRLGHNTDSAGFAESFRDEMNGCSLRRVLQLGAGGGGMAVAHALLSLGAQELIVVDIDKRRAEQLVARLRKIWGREIGIETAAEAAVDRADGVVNTTPVGMAKYPGIPIRPELLTSKHWVADIVYFPPNTELVQRALALGCRTLTGIGMAVGQAVRSFELFAGVSADRRAMSGYFGAAA
jgi:shikimate dehydrogenase